MHRRRVGDPLNHSRYVTDENAETQRAKLPT